MNLLLSSQLVGEPHWELVPIGDFTTTLCQWYNPKEKRWISVPWFTQDRFVANISTPNYRRPVTWRAKVSAAIATVPKWTKRILRLTPQPK